VFVLVHRIPFILPFHPPPLNLAPRLRRRLFPPGSRCIAAWLGTGSIMSTGKGGRGSNLHFAVVFFVRCRRWRGLDLSWLTMGCREEEGGEEGDQAGDGIQEGWKLRRVVLWGACWGLARLFWIWGNFGFNIGVTGCSLVLDLEIRSWLVGMGMAIVDPFQCCSASEFVPLEICSAAFVSNACGYCCHCCLKTLINCSIFICGWW
jgi:hypothetical protein